MAMETRRRQIIFFALACVVALAWISASRFLASDDSEKTLAGTYDLSGSADTSTLILHPDHTFEQRITRGQSGQSAHGAWQSLGRQHIEFSREFLPVSGEEPDVNGQTVGEFSRPLGILRPEIRLATSHSEWYVKPNEAGGANLFVYTGPDEVTATLVLLSGGKFEQTYVHHLLKQVARGTWSFDERGNMTLSGDFIKATGDRLIRGEFVTLLGGADSAALQIVIATRPSSGVPAFTKRTFR